MDLFQAGRKKQIQEESPLANRMRPRNLDEYVGQAHIVGPGRLLRRAIQADQLSSLIFYGPPGTGKTTLAMVIANSTQSHFITINAVLSGVKQIREAIDTAKERRNLYGQRTTLFVDEVHRWNKAQQDALLPHVEKGTIILIGATTENPYYEVNKALVSRSRIFQLKPLTADDLRQIAQQALSDSDRGYGRFHSTIDPQALDHLIDVANGDARGVLNALELAVETTEPDENGRIHITLNVAEESIQRRAVLYDKDGDTHYDTISAFIKSIRGSDPDAALYWMAKMVYAGEDARFIFRRMAILASEDVGMADPHAISVVINCWQSFERIGMPEGRFPLAHAALYLATAPKSNTTLAFFDALAAVQREQEDDVPNHLKDANRDKEGFGHGQGYLYPHAYRDHWVAQQYLPSALQGKLFYQPSDQGYEHQIQQEVTRKREAQLAVILSTADESGEILTTSPRHKGREAWLQRTISNSGKTFAHIREKIFELAKVQRHHVILDLKADNGLLLWEAVRQAPEGGVWGLTGNQQASERLSQQASRLPEVEQPTILTGTIDELNYLLTLRGEEELKFDCIIAHNPLTRLFENTEQIAVWHDYLQPNGRIVFAQIIPQRGQRIYQLIDWSDHSELQTAVATSEEQIWTAADNTLTNWAIDDLEATLTDNGWHTSLSAEPIHEQRHITKEMLQRWFQEDNPYYQALVTADMSDKQLATIQSLYKSQLENQVVNWSTQVAYITLTSPQS